MYVYSPKIWPMAAAILLVLLLAGYSWRRRSVPGAVPFIVSCLLNILAVTGLLMTYLAVEPETKIFWFRFQCSGLVVSLTANTCFVLDYAWPGRWLTRRNLILISIVPFLSVLYFFLFSGGLNPLVPVQFIVGETVTTRWDLVGHVIILFILALTLINLIVFTWLFIRSPQHRWPVLLMAAAQITTRGFALWDQPSVDAQVFNFPVIALPYLPYAIALFGFHIFDPLPLARQMVIDQLHAGIIVLDPQERMVSLNPAAEKILGATTSQACGQPVCEWLPAHLRGLLVDSPGTEFEFSLGSEPELRFFTLAISLLKDFRGLEIGRLLLLHDITEQKKAQAKILEQQRALATQNERERMARELHDSLGQVLSYASLQVQTAAGLSRGGQGEAAGAQLDRLEGVVREAHADLREYILNLHSTASLQQPFFPTVRQYLDFFTTNYDIQTLLNVSPDLNCGFFLPGTQLQLVRILQEALSNARKHGRAHQVKVSFTRDDGSLRMAIEDNGCGFDMDEMERRGGSHFGLQFMHERAAQLEGSLVVKSAPGTGTRVDLIIPWKDGETRGREKGETRR